MLVHGRHRSASPAPYVDGPLKIVGMAFQNPTLPAVAQYLAEHDAAARHRAAASPSPAPVQDKYVAQAKELLAAVGLAGFEDTAAVDALGGMQQREACAARSFTIRNC